MKPLSLVAIVALLVGNQTFGSENSDSVIVALPETSIHPSSELPDAHTPSSENPFSSPADAEIILPSLPAYERVFDGKPMEGGLQINPLATRMPSMSYIPGVAMIHSWGSGGLFATGSRQNLPGLMGIESGGLNFSQRVGAFTLSLFGSATKYGYYRGLSTSYGFGGSLSYDINEHLGVTIFGSYASPAGINQVAMIGYVDAPVFGGYLDWRISSHWGVKVGAQSYRSIAYGRWETQPIVMPYYRTSGGAQIGVDLGGLLYQVIRSASGNRWGSPGNPTIDPRAGFGPPPIRPHQ